MIDPGNLIGLLNADPEVCFIFVADNDPELPTHQRLIADREAARSAGDSGEADKRRNVLSTMEVQPGYSSDGTYWRQTA